MLSGCQRIAKKDTFVETLSESNWDRALESDSAKSYAHGIWADEQKPGRDVQWSRDCRGACCSSIHYAGGPSRPMRARTAVFAKSGAPDQRLLALTGWTQEFDREDDLSAGWQQSPAHGPRSYECVRCVPDSSAFGTTQTKGGARFAIRAYLVSVSDDILKSKGRASRRRCKYRPLPISPSWTDSGAPGVSLSPGKSFRLACADAARLRVKKCRRQV